MTYLKIALRVNVPCNSCAKARTLRLLYYIFYRGIRINKNYAAHFKRARSFHFIKERSTGGLVSSGLPLCHINALGMRHFLHFYPHDDAASSVLHIADTRKARVKPERIRLGSAKDRSSCCADVPRAL